MFIPYITAGYPTKEDTVPILFALEKGGAGIIEIGDLFFSFLFFLFLLH